MPASCISAAHFRATGLRLSLLPSSFSSNSGSAKDSRPLRPSVRRPILGLPAREISQHGPWGASRPPAPTRACAWCAGSPQGRSLRPAAPRFPLKNIAKYATFLFLAVANNDSSGGIIIQAGERVYLPPSLHHLCSCSYTTSYTTLLLSSPPLLANTRDRRPTHASFCASRSCPSRPPA